MIDYKVGDILAEDAEALVNTVNCVGIMGRGIALQFKKAFPDNFKEYVKACESGEVQPGRIFVFETGSLTNPKFIFNFPTKRHWRGKSRMEDIEAGLEALVAEIAVRKVRSIAIPPLGSGLGGLEWREVRKRIESALKITPEINVILFEPGGKASEGRANRSTDVPKMTPGRAALVSLMDRYLKGLLDPFVTLLEMHKLMYFLQESGQDLRLKYKKQLYGPYAENLRHVLHAVEGHFISGYLDGGDQPHKELGLVPGALEEASSLLNSNPEMAEKLEEVAHLVEGFETPLGLELLSTVHWIAKYEAPGSISELTSSVYSWNSRKKQFSERQIKVAHKALVDKGWVGEVGG